MHVDGTMKSIAFSHIEGNGSASLLPRRSAPPPAGVRPGLGGHLQPYGGLHRGAPLLGVRFHLLLVPPSPALSLLRTLQA
jgi:hypothetical protein